MSATPQFRSQVAGHATAEAQAGTGDDGWDRDDNGYRSETTSRHQEGDQMEQHELGAHLWHRREQLQPAEVVRTFGSLCEVPVRRSTAERLGMLRDLGTKAFDATGSASKDRSVV